MLYTGKGDSGTTTAFGCDQTRISKSSELPEALGAVDELNSFLGYVKTRADEASARVVRDAQETLFIVQAELGGAPKSVDEKKVAELEEHIAAIEQDIPPLKGFSVAGGTELSALFDTARAIARRAERRVIALEEAGIRTLASATKAYLNRLSSLLFALARKANHDADVAEETPSYR